MPKYNYQYETSPRKVKPEYQPKRKTNQRKKYDEQIIINEKQRKEAIKMEKKKHNKNVAFIMAIFLILLAISYRSSLINEKFSALQKDKETLSSLQKTNDQLEVSIESSLNLKNIEETAKEKLGMQKLDNNQKVYVNLDKKDYVEASTEDIDAVAKEEQNWFIKIINKILGK